MIANHVTSLDLSRQLYEAGLVVESEFEWELGGAIEGRQYTRLVRTGSDFKYDPNCVYYPAPLSSELGELLSEKITYDDMGEPMEYGNVYLTIQKVGIWEVGYVNSNKGSAFFDSVEDKTLANALSKMLLYLKEKGLL